MMSGKDRALLATVVMGIVLSVAGCREDEQGRPLVEEKGVYEGPADEQLSDERLSELKSRTAGQKF